MKFIPLRTAFVLGCSLAISSTAPAATFLWNVASPGANNWNVNANWTPNTGNPGAADTATFGSIGTSANATTINNVVSVNTTISALNFTNSASGAWHVTQIPSGVTLTVSGNTVLGTGLTADGLVTSAAAVDAGTWVISNGNLTIGNSGSSAVPGASTLDLSGLSNFVYSAAAGTLGLGAANRSAATVNFAAASNNVTAGTANFNTGSTSSTGNGTNRLGAGTNIFNINLWTNSAGRMSCTLNFLASTGGLRIRGTNGNADDTARVATMVVGNRNTGGSGGTTTGTLSFNGHTVDIKVTTLNLGQCGSSSGVTTASVVGVGNLQFDRGIVDVNSINLGVVTGGSTNGATGNITVGTNATLTFARLTMGTNGSTGNVTISTANLTNSGTIICNGDIAKATAANTTGNIVSSGGNLNLGTNRVGSAALPMDTFSLTNATIHVKLDGNVNVTNITTATLNLGGQSSIVVDSLANGPSVPGVPKNFPIIKYTTTENGSAGANFDLPVLPAGYIGVMADFNVAGTNQVVLQVYTNVTTGRTLIWSGATSADWDVTTQNWKTNGVGAIFGPLDAVVFNEALTSNPNVNLTQVLLPTSVTVANSVTAYTFSGPGKITGTGALTKQAGGSLTIDNAAINDFSGGVLISAGTVQVGNGDTQGNLPYQGNITNNGALIYNRTDSVAISNAISGSGTLTQIGSGTLAVSGVQTYTGKTEADSGTFILNGSLSGGGILTNAVGSTLVVSGTNSGPVNVDGALVPGGTNTAATMGAGGGFLLASGATVAYDINSATTPGGGTNDLIEVTGNLALNGNSISVNLLGSPVIGSPYRLMDYTGSKSGVFNATVNANTHLTPTLDQTTAHQINLTFSGTPASLMWNSGTGTWDVGASQTWSNAITAVNPDVFYQADSVFFNDVSGVTTTISIPAGVAVSPTSISNNSTAGVNEFTISGPGKITGTASLIKDGTSTLTLSGTNSFTGPITVNSGTLKGTALNSLGLGPITVNAGATLVFGAINSNAVTLVNATMAPVSVDITNHDLTASATTTNILESFDATTTTTSRNIEVDGAVHGSGTIVAINASGILNPDGNQGVRFRTTNTSDFTGSVIYTNNTKGEILVSGAGPFSPINTGKLFLWAGEYDGGNTTTCTSPGGYMEFNVRNNSSGDTVIGNDIEIDGTPGAVVINSLGSAPNNAVATFGKLTIGSGQELIGYKTASGSTNAIKFSSVSLTGGTATFSPKSSTFGVTTNAGTFIILNNITESSPSSLTMNGLSTLTIQGADTYTGSTLVQQGRLLLNGAITGGGSLTVNSGAVLAGTGTNNGLVDVSGTLYPGDVGVVGTFTAGSLTLESAGQAVFDLSGTNTANSGVNDLVQVNGNLTLNGGILSNNVTQSSMQLGSYRLFNYTGSLALNTAPSVLLALNGAATRYNGALDTGTAHQVNLNVTGGPVPIVWDSTASTAWDVGPSGTGNWSNTVSHLASDMFFTGDTVLLNDVPGVQTNLVITGITVTPTAITNNSGTNYAITGTGSIGGSAVVTKTGAGTLTLGTTNTFTGNTVVSGGTLLINNTNALGSWASTATITNGGTFDIGGLGTAVAAGNPLFGPKQFFIGGAGVGNNGVLVNSGANQQLGAYENITLVAPATFGGTTRWDMRNGTPGPVLDLAGFKLTKTNVNQISLVSVYVTAGNIDINQGVLSFETTSTITNGGTVTVNPLGSLGSFRLNAGSFTRQVVLNGGTVTNLNGGGATNDAPITINADSLVTGNLGNDLYLRGPISGSFGLIKSGSNTLFLTGTNTYGGTTTISNGIIALLDGASSLTNSPNIVVTTNGTLDLTRRTGSVPANTLTLISGQTLNASGSVLAQVVADSGAIVSGIGTIASNLTINSGALLSPGGSNAIGRLTVGLSPGINGGGSVLMEIDKGNAATNDQVFASGPIIYGGTLTVTNIGATPLAAGDTFKLFSGSLYPTAFTALNLASPGGSLYWYTNNLNVDGTLSISNAVVPGPTTNATITKVTLSSTNLLIHGTNNNVPNNTFHYVVLSTPNLTNTFSNWTPVVTNPFNPDGTFDYTNPIVPGTPRQFIDIQVVP